MKTLILQSSFDARRPAKWIMGFILILFGFLGAQAPYAGGWQICFGTSSGGMEWLR